VHRQGGLFRWPRPQRWVELLVTGAGHVSKGKANRRSSADSAISNIESTRRRKLTLLSTSGCGHAPTCLLLCQSSSPVASFHLHCPLACTKRLARGLLPITRVAIVVVEAAVWPKDTLLCWALARCAAPAPLLLLLLLHKIHCLLCLL
jgi:hypothetical protein